MSDPSPLLAFRAGLLTRFAADARRLAAPARRLRL